MSYPMTLQRALDNAIAAENRAAINGLSSPSAYDPIMADFLSQPIENVLSPEAMEIVLRGPVNCPCGIALDQPCDIH